MTEADWKDWLALFISIAGFLTVAIVFFRWYHQWRTETYPNSAPRQPGEQHLRPAYNYCGAGTRNMNNPPINDLDECCRAHDEDYANGMDTREADDRLIDCAIDASVDGMNEEVDRGLLLRAMETKEQAENIGLLSENDFR